MWTYVQSTGELIDSTGKRIGAGYSGSGPDKNNPASQGIRDRGPLPCGIYYLGKPVDTITHGPYFIPLTPGLGNQMFGRSGFAVHGDSIKQPGTASNGCIILPRVWRELMWKSSDHMLQVVSGLKGANQ